MKALMMSVLLAAVAAGPAAAAQDIKEIGLGIVAGDPIGGSAKLWLDKDYALDVGVGYSASPVFWGDILWHTWSMLPQPKDGKLGLYLGAGPRIETADDPEFGVRTMAGLTWRLASQPLEFFLEAGPVFRMTPRGGVDADGGVGVRLYLGGK